MRVDVHNIHLLICSFLHLIMYLLLSCEGPIAMSESCLEPEDSPGLKRTSREAVGISRVQCSRVYIRCPHSGPAKRRPKVAS